MSSDKMEQSQTLVGVIGHPIKHSYSPFMHNNAFRMAGLNYVYLPFDIFSSNLEDAMKGIVAWALRDLMLLCLSKKK